MNMHILLDNIRSAYNVGSFFRTADATGCTKLYLCGMTACPGNPKLSKTALGATKTVEWEYFQKTTEAVDSLIERQIPVYAVELEKDAQNYREVDYPDEIAFVFGHEVRGIDQKIIDMCEKCVMIPMLGQKESLNVATAAGIIMFNFLGSGKG
ncbi:TrmH family RNA methyltransferase [Candidatus Dojkabacteria bacterium]|nr:TrmH family RNA methyltransferase [Candidatus Dojkabacteria bacterium]